MSKKHFIALANAIRKHNASVTAGQSQTPFDGELISTLADFCRSQNFNFKRDRWLAYIAGECGQNGGAIKS